MDKDELFTKLWNQYTEQNPMVRHIFNSFSQIGETIINDHIALRTFNDPRVNIKVLEKPFLNVGYREKGTYRFEEKKLNAKHYEIPGEPNQPRVFISELIIEDFSSDLQNTIKELLNSTENNIYNDDFLVLKGNIWGKPSHKVYHNLRKESEFAAWLYAFGFRANHFTVSINHLKNLQSIEMVNGFLKENGFELNHSGGEIKGTKNDLLQQSSTLAENVMVDFIEGSYEIPGCYYEFAIRYKNKNGELFNGFLAKSANKIFESTDFRK